MSVLAIDPGSERSALVCYDGYAIDREWNLHEPNDEVLKVLRLAARGVIGHRPVRLLIEDTKAFALPRAKGGNFFPEQVRVTARWVGRFIEAWGGEYELLDRREIKLWLTGQPTAGDPQIREALVDRFGGNRAQAIGKKKTPGPLYGIKGDLWAALAVAVTWCERREVGS